MVENGRMGFLPAMLTAVGRILKGTAWGMKVHKIS